MISIAILLAGLIVFAQKPVLKSNLATSQRIQNRVKMPYQINKIIPGTLPIGITTGDFKNQDQISIIDIGTSANAFSYGIEGGQRSLLCAKDAFGIVSNFHRMGGALDPGGNSGDMGYDVSTDWGTTWSCQNECYQAIAQGWMLVEMARYPQHGIYNPAGNTNPDEAYLVYFAPTLDMSNGFSWGGYAYGRAKIGDLSDTTKHLIASNPGQGIYQYIPDGFTVNAIGDFWAIDYNLDMTTVEEGVWLQELIINHGTWNESLEDYELSQSLLPCPTHDSAGMPPCARVEFSPDGQFGYIVVLSDNGSVEISDGRSLYPILWRSEDYGQSWTDPVEIALAGATGIQGVQNFLSVDELEELYEGPIPQSDEIEFTTAYDFDLSVDANGNPQIAVVVGVSGQEAYSIVTERSPSSGYLYMAPFLLSSTNMGEPGSWHGLELGRLLSFRGSYNELIEDNRIQIARDAAGQKMFVAWLDSDTIVSGENNTPNIYASGVDLPTMSISWNYELGGAYPINMTYGSDATFSAHLFALANEVIYNSDTEYPFYILPMVYQGMNPNDPLEPVQYKYIQDAFIWEQQFLTGPPPPGIREHKKIISESPSVYPNPASTEATCTLVLARPATIRLSLNNLMGQEVKCLIIENARAGSNALTLDVSALQGGVYFYTINVREERFAGKLVVR